MADTAGATNAGQAQPNLAGDPRIADAGAGGANAAGQQSSASPPGAGATGATPPGGNTAAQQPNTLSKDTPPPPAPEWPDDWREKMAKGDEKLLKRLERFTDPGQVTKSWVEADTKIRAGQAKAPLPENPSPEQLTEWRKDNGIPETPDGYALDLGEYVVGDADKPLVDQFKKDMHTANAAPGQVNQALKTYYKMVEQMQVQRAEADKKALTDSRAELRQEWGNTDYDVNFNAMQAMLESSPPGVAEIINGARSSDGTPLGYKKEFIKFMVQQAREINPIATVVPNGGGDRMASVQEEMKSIEGKMGSTSYTQEMRERYAALTDAVNKTKARSA